MGFAWHFVIPIIMMIVYYVVFNTIRPNSIPEYWVYLSSGLFPFTFMMENLNRGPGAITSNSGMVKKMYFPRIILILSEVISSFIVMIIGYTMVLIGILAIGHDIGVQIIVLPVILVLMTVFVTGYVLLLSSITVYFRDIQYLINSLSMVFYFITPMYFTMNDVSGLFVNIIAINPFAYYVQAYHQILYYNEFPDITTLSVCALLPLVSITVGLIVFHYLKRGFAERL